MTYRADAVEVRLGPGSTGLDPKLIDDIPDDWNDPNKFYVLRPLVDPDDATKVATQWIDIMPFLLALTGGGAGGGGYGVYGTY